MTLEELKKFIREETEAYVDDLDSLNLTNVDYESVKDVVEDGVFSAFIDEYGMDLWDKLEDKEKEELDRVFEETFREKLKEKALDELQTAFKLGYVVAITNEDKVVFIKGDSSLKDVLEKNPEIEVVFTPENYKDLDLDFATPLIQQSFLVRRKIVTHVPPRHLDDTLAVALLLQKYDGAEVEFVHPQRDAEKIMKYRKDPNVILVDVGRRYDPKFGNYDHHQDLGLPFSLKLVLKNEFPEYLAVIENDKVLNTELDFFDVKDRFGYQEAVEQFGNRTSLLLESLVLEQADRVEKLKALGKTFKQFLDRKLDVLKALEKVEVKTINGLKVAFDPTGIRAGEIFSRIDADVLIQRNTMNPDDTSVIRNSNSVNVDVIDLSRLKEERNDVGFIHPSGFIAVINKPFEEVKKEAEKIVKTVIDLNRDNDSGMDL